MPTQTTYRRALAPLLGPLERGTATSGSTATSSLVCTGASHTGLRFKSSFQGSSRFKGKWLHRPAAANANDLDRLISLDTPSTGTFTVEDAYTAAAYTGGAGEAFEISSLFSGTKMNALVNEGLKRCFVVVEFTFTVVSALTKRHDMTTTTAPWLTDPDWVLQVGTLPTGTTRNQADPYRRRVRGEATKDGPTVYLEGPGFATTDTIYVKALKPAYDHCRASAGTFGDRSGLAAETHEAPVDELWVAWAAVLAGQDELDALLAGDGATKEGREARAVAAGRFSSKTAEQLQIPERTFVPAPTYLGTTHRRPVRFR